MSALMSMDGLIIIPYCTCSTISTIVKSAVLLTPGKGLNDRMRRRKSAESGVSFKRESRKRYSLSVRMSSDFQGRTALYAASGNDLSGLAGDVQCGNHFFLSLQFIEHLDRLFCLFHADLDAL